MSIWAIALVAVVGSLVFLAMLAILVFLVWMVKSARRIRPPRITHGTGPRNVGPYAATLPILVTDHGRENPSVCIFWGLHNGEDNPTINQNSQANRHNRIDLGEHGLGEAVYRVEGLQSGTTYWYRGYALNSAGENWASTSSKFTTPLAVQPRRVSAAASGKYPQVVLDNAQQTSKEAEYIINSERRR